jgi:hypothetical protein
MQKYARIDPNNRVSEILEVEDHVEPQSLHFEGYKIIKIENDSKVQERWYWDGKNLNPPKESRHVLLREASQKKKSRQAIGFMYDGHRIEATPESLGAITALRDGMDEGHLKDEVIFKSKSGFVKMNREKVDEILAKARQCHQAAIDAEAEIVDLINKGRVNTLDQVVKHFNDKLPIPEETKNGLSVV